jgi:uncharacterized protein YybS (DUF2232 family)
MNGYPNAFNHLLRLVLGMVFASGVLLIPNALDMRLGWHVPWALGGDLRAWMVSSHAASVYLTLLLAGALWTVHMRAGWLRQENVASGISLVLALSLLALTGLLLYYAGDEDLINSAVVMHIILGLMLPALLVGHILGARRARLRATRPR